MSVAMLFIYFKINSFVSFCFITSLPYLLRMAFISMGLCVLLLKFSGLKYHIHFLGANQKPASFKIVLCCFVSPETHNQTPISSIMIPFRFTIFEITSG